MNKSIIHTKISELARVERPREKMIERGPATLGDTELLAILLGSGIRGKSALGIASGILKRYGQSHLSGLSYETLGKVAGVGEARACVILAALELGRRIFEKKNDHVPVIDGPESVFRLIRDLALHKKEHFVSLYLNAKNQVLKRETISIGSLFANMVHPREVFAPALEVSAAALVLAHNHPSGDPEPSPQDIVLTQRLVEAGNLMGIEVLDHIVIGQQGYVSFQERKLI